MIVLYVECIREKTADLDRRFQAFESKCYRTVLCMSYKENKTNEYVCMATGQYPRQTSGIFIVNRCKLSWFGQVCSHNTLPKKPLQVIVDCSPRRGSQRKLWGKKIKEWTYQSLSSLLRITDDKVDG